MKRQKSSKKASSRAKKDTMSYTAKDYTDALQQLINHTDLDEKIQTINGDVRALSTGKARYNANIAKLLPLVGTAGKKDIGMSRKLMTLKGCQDYIEKRSERERNAGYPEDRVFGAKYEAYQEDADNDGIDDVFIRGKGEHSDKYYSINGHRMKKSKAPKRLYYYNNTTPEERQQLAEDAAIEGMSAMQYFYNDKDRWEDPDLIRKGIISKKSPYQKFCRHVGGYIYRTLCDRYTLKTDKERDLPYQTKCYAAMWNQYIIPNLMVMHLAQGGDLTKGLQDWEWLNEEGLPNGERDARNKKISRIKSSSEFKAFADTFVEILRKTPFTAENSAMLNLIQICRDTLSELVNEDAPGPNGRAVVRHSDFGALNEQYGLDWPNVQDLDETTKQSLRSTLNSTVLSQRSGDGWKSYSGTYKSPMRTPAPHRSAGHATWGKFNDSP